MGREKKNKPRRKVQALHQTRRRRTAEREEPSEISWTPLKQACGCVVDWGWSGQTADPLTFMKWCQQRPSRPCPWHDTSGFGPSGDELPDRMMVEPHGTGQMLYVRKASESHLELGAELTARLEALLRKREKGDSALLDDAPAGYRSWLIAETPDPAQALFDQSLMDILLNQGRSWLPREVLERLPAPSPSSSQQPPQAPETADCEVCAWSVAAGGFLCTCGHDWSCHPGDIGDDPCSHCDCKTMHHREFA